jgi:hypothetical protein
MCYWIERMLAVQAEQRREPQRHSSRGRILVEKRAPYLDRPKVSSFSFLRVCGLQRLHRCGEMHGGNGKSSRLPGEGKDVDHTHGSSSSGAIGKGVNLNSTHRMCDIHG